MRRSAGFTLSALTVALALALSGCGAPAGNVPTIVPTLTSAPPTATTLTPTTAPPMTGTTAPATGIPLTTTPTGITAPSPVSGSVLVEDGNSVAGGVAGETIELHVQFEASSTAGQVKELRASGTFGGCAREAEMEALAWEPFVVEKVYTTTASTNFLGWYASVQYRDTAGNVSPVYCDDISIEGMPPIPSP